MELEWLTPTCDVCSPISADACVDPWRGVVRVCDVEFGDKMVKELGWEEDQYTALQHMRMHNVCLEDIELYVCTIQATN